MATLADRPGSLERAGISGGPGLRCHMSTETVCEAAQSSVQTIYKWGLNSFRWGSTEQERMAPQNRTERNHNRMLGHSQEPKSKNSGNKETQNGQSLYDSKSENQSSILINTHFRRHKANTAFLSDRVQSTNQLTDMCKVINSSPFARQN